MYRYSNGSTPDQQQEANRRYRRKQAHYRQWLDDVAAALGLNRDQLTTSRNAELVARALALTTPQQG